MKWSAEQNLAINESGKSIVVSAGAGSGKTAVLTERIYTKIVKEHISLENLIVLTFTNAAALEMKMRVAKRLSNEKDNPEVQKALDYIDQATISTFDSFSLNLVKKYGYLLNLTDDINITDKVILLSLKDSILEEILEKRYEREDFKNLVSNLIFNNDSDFKSSLLKLYETFEYKIDVDSFLNEYEDKYLSKSHIEYLTNLYIHQRKTCEDEINKRYEYIVNLVGKLKKYSNLLEKLKMYINDEKVILAFPKNDDENVLDEVKKNVEIIKDCHIKLKENYIYAEEEIMDLIKNTICKQREIISILKEFNSILESEKKRLNLFNFSDIAKLSIKILEEFDWVRNDIKYKTKEILIDEYQDTSDVQDFLISLIENNNTYYVGDIKQSIYGFRGANPNLFKSKCEKNFKIDLSNNFRSRSDVLDCVNKIFDNSMSDKVGGADYKAGHALHYGFKKYSTMSDENYQALVYEYMDASVNKEISIIANDILSKVGKYMVYDKHTDTYRKALYKDFVIITREKKSYEKYLEEFNKRQIPLSMYKDERFLAGDEIYVICSLLNYAIDYNMASAYSILRSFLFEYEDSYTKEDFDKLKERIDLVKQKSNNPYELLENLIFEFELLNKLTKLDNYELRRLKVYKTLEVSKAIMNVPDDSFNIQSYFDYIKTELENYSLDVKVPNENSVKIMTIHASKGLEYPICYFSELYKPFEAKDMKGTLLFSESLGILVPFGSGINKKTNPFKYMLKEEALANVKSEELRLLYVALTRAREKIIMLIPNNSKKDLKEEKYDINKAKSMAEIIRIVYENLQVEEKNVDDIVEAKTISKNISNTDEIALLKEISYKKELIKSSISSHQVEGLVEDSIKDVLKVGIRYHKYLEIIDFFNYEQSMIELNLSNKDKNILNKFFQLDILNGIINTYKEHYFEYEEDNKKFVGIIDLILEYDNKVCIIDYKLSDTSKEYYVDQLKSYKSYLSKVFDKEIETYLYSIMKGELTKVCLE